MKTLLSVWRIYTRPDLDNNRYIELSWIDTTFQPKGAKNYFRYKELEIFLDKGFIP